MTDLFEEMLEREYCAARGLDYDAPEKPSEPRHYNSLPEIIKDYTVIN